jgi:hypothetical protein
VLHHLAGSTLGGGKQKTGVITEILCTDKKEIKFSSYNIRKFRSYSGCKVIYEEEASLYLRKSANI